MNKEVAGFFLVYSEQEHKGEYHLYIRGLFLRYDHAFDAAIRLAKYQPYKKSEQPDYELIHEKEDEVRLLNNLYRDEDDTHEEIVIARLHVQ